MPINHAFVSAVADSADASVVRPSHWNADHTIDDDTIVWTALGAGSGSKTTDNAGLPLKSQNILRASSPPETATLAARQQVSPIARMSLQEVDAEIGALLRKKLRTDEEEVTLLVLMAAAGTA